MTSFDKAQQKLEQAQTLVQHTLFPVVLGFEFYPVIFIPPNKEADQEIYLAKGFQVVLGKKMGSYSPGQLIIFPLVPLASLKISLEELHQALREASFLWLRSKKVGDDKGIILISEDLHVCINVNENPFLQMDLKQVFDEWTLYFGSCLLKILPAPRNM